MYFRVTYKFIDRTIMLRNLFDKYAPQVGRQLYEYNNIRSQ